MTAPIKNTDRGYVRLNAAQKSELDDVQQEQADKARLRITQVPAGRVVQALARLGRKHADELAEILGELA